MNTKFHNLPPHKRFSLTNNHPVSSSLPAKKRKETRDPHSIPTNLETVSAVTTVCLPAKKRICALHPNHFSNKPFSPFDLNLEYDPKSDDVISIKKNDGDDVITPVKNVDGSANDDVITYVKSFDETNVDDIIIADKKLDEVDDDEDGIVCAVCQSTDADPSDPIVFCDGCNLMVHTTCYGYPLTDGVPEGDWFCSQCQITDKNKSLSCCLCPVKGGALKRTVDGRWAHIVCTLFIPEVFFSDPEGREGINCSKVVARRWGKRCYVCKQSKGCVVDCSEEKCCLRFHVTCGLKEDLCIEYKEGRNRGAIVAGFCKTHTDLWMKQQVTGKYKIVARNEE